MSSTPSSPQEPVRIGVMISGRGSNLQALVHAQESGQLGPGRIVRVISNRRSAAGLDFAQKHHIPTTVVPGKQYPTREAADEAIVEQFRQDGVQWVLMAGYNRIITPVLIHAFAPRILNIHPSLLPAYGGVGMVGIKVHETVLAQGETETGCTVHGVIEAVDEGPVFGQRRVPVYADDTPDTLAQRVLEQEHQLYPAVVRQVLTGELSLHPPVHVRP